MILELFFAFFALDRLCPLFKKKKKKLKTSIAFFVCLGLKRAENIFGGYRKISLSKIIFVYKGDPLKKVNFSPQKMFFFLHLLILEIFTLSKCHSPKRKKNEKNIEQFLYKWVKMRILKNGLH